MSVSFAVHAQRFINVHSLYNASCGLASFEALKAPNRRTAHIPREPPPFDIAGEHMLQDVVDEALAQSV